jgi:hypothetical protein
MDLMRIEYQLHEIEDYGASVEVAYTGDEGTKRQD